MTANPAEVNVSNNAVLIVGGAMRISLYGWYEGVLKDPWTGQTGMLLSTTHLRAFPGTHCQ